MTPICESVLPCIPPHLFGTNDFRESHTVRTSTYKSFFTVINSRSRERAQGLCGRTDLLTFRTFVERSPLWSVFRPNRTLFVLAEETKEDYVSLTRPPS